MKKIIITLASLLIFSILTNISFAYAPVSINTTTGGYIDSWFSGLACTNITGTFSCYMVGNDGAPNYNILLEKYNETLGFLGYCDTGLTDTAGTSAIDGIAIANTTHLVLAQRDGTYRLANISTCAVTTAFGTHTAGLGDLLKGSYYNGLNYWGSPIRLITNSTTQAVLASGFWSVHDTGISFPNESDNSTMYSIVENSALFLQWTNGVYTGYKMSVEDYFGTGIYYNNVYPFAFELHNDGTETWVYWLGEDGRLYRGNFTALPSNSSLDFYAVYPIDNTSVSDNPPVLHIYINSSINGTLTWYLNNSIINTQAFIGSNTSQDIYYTPSSSLSLGAYNWSVTYNITPTANWTTGTHYFIEGALDFFDTPMEVIALTFAGLFNVSDLSTAKDLFSVILSLGSGVAVVVIMSHFTKGKLDIKTALGFIPMWTLIMLVFFGIAGFLSLGLSLMVGAITLVLIFYSVKSGS